MDSDFMENAVALRTTYDHWRIRGIEAARRGQLDEAKDAFCRARELASGLDQVTQDRALCNVVAIDIEFGIEIEEHIPELRQILVKNQDVENGRLAAYHLARIYDLRKEFRKGLFYARVALERSNRANLDHWIAGSHNQMGTLLIAESQFAEGQAHLEKALALSENDDDAIARALILGNLAYCRMVQGEFKTGFASVFEGLRTIQREGADAYFAPFHMTLCFGYLEIGRLRHAERHGRRGLELAREQGDLTTLKNCLFLLGEVASASGNLTAAEGYFSTLQQQFYPQHDFLSEFLLTVDVRGLVNLRA